MPVFVVWDPIAMPRRLPRLPLLGAVLADRSGAAAFMTVLALPMLAGFGLLGVDAAEWYWERRNLQTAADAAALAGALARHDGADVDAAALADAVRNGYASGAGTIAVQNPPDSGPGAGDPTAVAVTLRQPLPMFYARLVGRDAAEVEVTATAAMTEDGEYCIVGLDRERAKTVEITGNGSLQMTCGIAVNSIHSGAFYMGGSALVEATTASVTGGVDVSGNPDAEWTAGPPQTGRAPVKDPYADLDAPSPGACAEDKLTVGTKDDMTLDAGGGTMTLCDGLKVQGTLHFEPGVYIVDGGEVSFGAQSSVTGTDVTLILTGQGGDYATLDINAGAEVDLRAPTSGPWADIAIYQDRAAPGTSGSGLVTNHMNGNASLHIEGVVYFPSQKIYVNGTGSSSSGCMNVVARQVAFSGNSSTVNTCPTRTLKKISAYRVALIR